MSGLFCLQPGNCNLLVFWCREWPADGLQDIIDGFETNTSHFMDELLALLSKVALQSCSRLQCSYRNGVIQIVLRAPEPSNFITGLHMDIHCVKRQNTFQTKNYGVGYKCFAVQLAVSSQRPECHCSLQPQTLPLALHFLHQ